jgi:ABC-type tungstate transport system substrate-binding protein
LEAAISNISPANKREEVYLSKTLNAFNFFIDARRHRIDAVDDGLPAAMWWTLILCALVSVITSYFLYLDDVRLHMVLTGALSLVIGLLIFLIASMDNPFKGEFSVSPQPYIDLLNSFLVR